MSKYKVDNVGKQTYSASEVAAYLGISRTFAYNLMRTCGFPSFRVGDRVLVTRAAFEQWIERQQNAYKEEKANEDA